MGVGALGATRGRVGRAGLASMALGAAVIDAYGVTLAGLLSAGALLLMALDPSLGMAAVGGVAAVLVWHWRMDRG